MSDTASRRPSLRHGLPYGWWRSTDVWAAAITALSLLALVVLGTTVLAAWVTP